MKFEDILNWVNTQVWGWPMLGLLLLTGLYMTFGLRLLSVVRIPYGFKQLFKKRTGNEDEGDVSPFAALMTALSSTIGTGNIAGVAAAIAIGGPGAVFWMWMTAIVGTATKFSEGVLAVRYREIDSNGNRVGGPMYYIKNGLGPKWKWLAYTFAFFGFFAALGTGASIQSNSVADALKSTYNLSPWITAFFIAGGAAAVIIGGIKRIGIVASSIVPVMAGLYILAGITVIILHADAIPEAFGRIFAGAFGLQTAGTGISVGLLVLAMQKGVARGIFSNEAGQGSAPIAHAAARNNDPVNQGIIAMLGTIIDTLIVCTITALVILTSGIIPTECIASPDNLQTLMSGLQPPGCDTGAPLTASAFDASLFGWGGHIVAIGLTVFAFTTILGWSYYGERCSAFLFTEKSIPVYRIFWIIVVFISAAAIALQKKVLSVVGGILSKSSNGELMLDGQVLLNNKAPIKNIYDGSGNLLEVSNLDFANGALNIQDGIVMLNNAPVQVDGPAVNIVNLFWLMADTLTGLMAAPNLIGIVLLSPVVFKLAKEYFDKQKTAKDGLVDQEDLP